MNRFSFLFYGLVYKALQAQIDSRSTEPKNGLAVYANDHLGLHAVIFGKYESEILEEVVKFLKKFSSSEVCIDAGANIGNHSLVFSKYFKKVIAFEPNPDILPLLTINLKDSKNCEIVSVALSNSSERKTLFVDHVNSGRTHLEKNDNRSLKKINVQCAKLDEFLNANSKTVSFLKVDVEGHETELFEGAMKTLKGSSPIIMLEVLSTDVENGEARSLNTLESFGYNSFFHVSCEPIRWSIAKNILRKIHCHNLLDALKCLFLGPPKASTKPLDIKKLQKIDYATVLAMK